jgi:enoyl-CoA hydratase/carnithine racemase
METTQAYQCIQVENKGEYDVLRLTRGRANAINQQMVDELREYFREAEASDKIRGVLLTGSDGFLSAGLDLIELYDYNEEEIKNFWRDFIDLVVEMTAFPKAMVCSVNGHAPAGGCLLSITADYRVMQKGNFKIGLNEIALGIIPPSNIHALYSFWIGQAKSYHMLLEGAMVGPEEAKEIHLVQELAETDEEAFTKAEKKLKQYLGFHPLSWPLAKKQLRAELNTKMPIDFERVFKPALDLWWQPQSRMIIKMMVDKLKSRKS